MPSSGMRTDRQNANEKRWKLLFRSKETEKWSRYGDKRQTYKWRDCPFICSSINSDARCWLCRLLLMKGRGKTWGDSKNKKLSCWWVQPVYYITSISIVHNCIYMHVYYHPLRIPCRVYLALISLSFFKYFHLSSKIQLDRPAIIKLANTVEPLSIADTLETAESVLINLVRYPHFRGSNII